MRRMALCSTLSRHSAIERRQWNKCSVIVCTQHAIRRLQRTHNGSSPGVAGRGISERLTKGSLIDISLLHPHQLPHPRTHYAAMTLRFFNVLLYWWQMMATKAITFSFNPFTDTTITLSYKNQTEMNAHTHTKNTRESTLLLPLACLFARRLHGRWRNHARATKAYRIDGKGGTICIAIYWRSENFM